MSSSGYIKVSVPSGGLMTLLGNSPEIMVEIHKLASEKIAEQVVRKIKNIEVAQVQAAAQRVVDDTMKLYKPFYRFPAEAEAHITKKIKEVLDLEFSRKKDDMVRALNERARTIEDQIVVNVESRLRPKIAEIARQEFLKVLQEVKSVTA